MFLTRKCLVYNECRVESWRSYNCSTSSVAYDWFAEIQKTGHIAFLEIAVFNKNEIENRFYNEIMHMLQKQ